MANLKPSMATPLQKETFISKFADIVQNNERLRDRYKIHFFDTATKSNYVFNGIDGKSINVIQLLSLEELEDYKKLKHHWQD